jgi:hypothetical protein
VNPLTYIFPPVEEPPFVSQRGIAVVSFRGTLKLTVGTRVFATVVNAQMTTPLPTTVPAVPAPVTFTGMVKATAEELVTM